MKDILSLKAEHQKLKLYLDILKTVDNAYHNVENMEFQDKDAVRKAFAPKIKAVVQRLARD